VGGAAGEPARLIVSVAAPAVDGKANKAVIAALAEAFAVRKRDVEIVFGQLHRDKRVSITGDEASLENKKSELIGSLFL
jgi:uncharacterized protein (TIGR00251 family)